MTLLRICYVLTVDQEPTYANEALLSAWSLKHYNPTVTAILITDPKSHENLQQAQHKILTFFDRTTQIPTPPGNATFRSRFLKTSIRKHVSGDFLYLDTDTLIHADLSSIFNTACDFAAVPDNNGSGLSKTMSDIERIIFQKMNWPMPQYCLNSGVLFHKNSQSAYQLSELWHKKWLKSYTQTGQHYDQPALNSALHETEIDFKWLEHQYNAQVYTQPNTAKNAAIWHIFASTQNKPPETLMITGANLINQDNGKTRFLEILDTAKHPWLDYNKMKAWYKKQILAEYLHIYLYALLATNRRKDAVICLSKNLSALLHVKPKKMIFGIVFRTLLTGKPPKWFKPKKPEQYDFLFGEVTPVSMPVQK